MAQRLGAKLDPNTACGHRKNGREARALDGGWRERSPRFFQHAELGPSPKTPADQTKRALTGGAHDYRSLGLSLPKGRDGGQAARQMRGSRGDAAG